MFTRLATFALLGIMSLAASAQAPKYVFYFIGDGMGMGPVLATETYNRAVLGNDQYITMLQFPVASAALTYSASSKVTDSAAAGTALSTGVKTKNGMLGMDPDTVAVYSIAKDFKEAGYGVAIATSVPVDDATPGAFYAHVPTRKMYYDICLDLAKSGYDFFAGGCMRGLYDRERSPEELLAFIGANGYAVARGKEEYEAVKQADKILLLNSDYDFDHIGYTIDSISTNLSLPFITQAVIDHLTRVAPDKFFTMIEGGNIDWAGHANDAGAMVKEIINFNQAIALAYDFYLKHPDETLIVVTADHNTGGMELGVLGGPSNPKLEYFDYQKVSIERMELKCRQWKDSGEDITWEAMKEYLTENLGLYGPIPVSEQDDQLIQEKFRKTFVDNDSEDTHTLYTTYNEFVATVFDVLAHVTGIGWTTTNHTGDFVPVYAVGVGADEFKCLNNNIEIPAKIRRIAGL